MTTYYLREGGTAANKAAATGPGSDASACMSVATHNGETFSAGDIIKVADDGGDIRGELFPPSSGSIGNPILYEPESGDSPMINGADLVTTWADQGGNVWRASFTPAGSEATPAKVFFDEVLGTEEGAQGDLNAVNEWYYDAVGDLLYVYSTSDPDTAYTDPGIEATSRDFCIIFANPASPAYNTIDGINCKYGEDACIKVTDTSRGIVIRNLTMLHAGNSNYIQSGTGPSDTQITSVTSSYAGKTTGDHGFYFNTTDETNGPFILDSCRANNAAGYGIQVYQTTGGTVRYCVGIDNAKGGITINQLVANSDATVYYCIFYGSGSEAGIVIKNIDNANTDVNIYNCTCYNNGAGGIEISACDSVSSTITITNNICFENSVTELNVFDFQASTFALDYNCYYKAAGTMIDWADNLYTQAQFSDYQIAHGQDANGISAIPLFTDEASDDFTLQPSSPCIDVGDDIGLTRDYTGITVPQGSAPDMGAHEYKRPKGIGRLDSGYRRRVGMRGIPWGFPG